MGVPHAIMQLVVVAKSPRIAVRLPYVLISSDKLRLVGQNDSVEPLSLAAWHLNDTSI